MSLQTFLLLAVLGALLLLAGRFGFGAGGLPAWLRPLFDTGTAYIFLGALLGPQGLGWLGSDLLQSLAPVVVIVLGWIGFLYGSHLEWRLLRRYPARLHLGTLMEAGLTLVLVGAGLWMLLDWLDPVALTGGHRTAAVFLLAICASGTAPAGVFLLSTPRMARGRILNLLRFMAALDDLPGLLVLALGVLLWPPVRLMLPGGFSLGSAPLWLAFTLVMGLALGWMTLALFPRTGDVRHNTLILLGVVALGAGAAQALSLPVLVVTGIAGAVFSNQSHLKESAYGLLAGREQTLYAVFLLAAGALTRFDITAVTLLLPAYLLVRTLGKVLGAYASEQFFTGERDSNPLLGTGLLFQGGMTLAVAVGFQHSHPQLVAPSVFTTLVLGVVVNELAGPMLAKWALSRERRP